MKLVERDQATRVASELMKTMGLDKTRVRDLQMAPLDKVMAAYFETMRRMNVDQMTQGFSPAVDGKAVPQHPFFPAASAVSPDVPLMLGSTRTELTSSAAAELFSLYRRRDAQAHRRPDRRERRSDDRRVHAGESGRVAVRSLLPHRQRLPRTADR